MEVFIMKKITKEKCTNTALSMLSKAATRMAVQSLNEISIATWYQPKIDVNLLARAKK